MRISHVALCALLIPAASAHADCTSEVNAAFAKLRSSPAFSMKTKITNAQGTLTMSNDYVPPDRMYQRISLSTGGPDKMELILIGKKAWSNQGNNGWVPLPPPFVDKIAKQMKETVVEPPKDESAFTCLGDVELEGKTYTAYSAKRPAEKAAAAKPNVQTVYIDKATGLPARNIVTPEDAPSTRLFDGTFTLVKDLKIVPPQS